MGFAALYPSYGLNAHCRIFCRRRRVASSLYCSSDFLDAMGRRPKRKNLKPPGRCIFCPGTRMSKEHFWSTWSKPMLPTGNEDAYHEEKLTHTRKTILVSRELRTRPGSAASKKLRVVCEDCNNGWMNEVEDRARPILEPLIAGCPTVLNQKQQRILAEWIAMKIMVAEHNTPEEIVISRADKEAFKANRIIPDYVTIWIGRHNVSAWCTTFARHAASLSLIPKPPPAVLAGRKNVETIAFGIGALFVYVLVSDPGVVDLNDLITVNHLPRVWPFTGSQILWGALVLRGNAPGLIATTLDRVIDRPRTLWMPLPEKS
jgi:hypothetical protein